MSSMTNFYVNDYLDLYLFAGKIGDTLWQHEIIEKLQNFTNENTLKDQTLDIGILWKNYKQINEEILTLYQQLRNHSSNEDIKDKIWNLKQQRILLGRQIGLATKSPSKN